MSKGEGGTLCLQKSNGYWYVPADRSRVAKKSFRFSLTPVVASNSDYLPSETHELL